MIRLCHLGDERMEWRNLVGVGVCARQGQRMGWTKCQELALEVRDQIRNGRSAASAQIDQASSQREEVFHAVIHLTEQQILLLLGTPPVRNIPCDLRSANDLPARIQNG